MDEELIPQTLEYDVGLNEYIGNDNTLTYRINHEILVFNTAKTEKEKREILANIRELQREKRNNRMEFFKAINL